MGSLFNYLCIICGLLVCVHSISSNHDHRHHETEHVQMLPDQLVELQPSSLQLEEKMAQSINDDYKWIFSSDAAAFSDIRQIKKIILPVRVSLLFIGLDGSGNKRLQLSEEQFSPWFAHIAHSLPYGRIPMGEEQTTLKRVTIKESLMEYFFSIQVARMHPLVTNVFSDVLRQGLREETLGSCEGKARPSINEHEDDDEDFDGKPIELLYFPADRMGSVVSSLLEAVSLNSSYTMVIMNPIKPVGEKQSYGYRQGMSEQEIAYIANHREEIGLPTADEGKKQARKEKPCSADSKPRSLPADVLFRSSGAGKEVEDIIAKSQIWAQWYLKEQSKDVMGVGDTAGTDLNEAEKATDIHDSSAGAFRIRPGSQNITNLALSWFDGSEFEREYILQILKHKPTHVHEDCLCDAYTTHGRSLWIDLAAGPFEWGPVVSGEGSRTHKTVPRPPEGGTIPFKNVDDVDSAEALEKLGVASNEAIRACMQNSTSEECMRLQTLVKTLAYRAHEVQATDDIRGSNSEGENADIVMDRFLAGLAGLISSAFRHVVVPPSPLFDTPYAPRVVFHTFIITDHNAYDPRGLDGFDYDEFRHELLRLKLPQQEFTFSLRQMSMESVPALGTAFQASLESVLLPTLSVEGWFTSSAHLFVDSRKMRQELRRVQDVKTTKSSVLERHIPIFIFSMNYQNPVFVDKYYPAKALRDMVIAVQSPQLEVKSRIACNGRPIFWNMRNPTKSILAAAALTFGGIVPSHISYNEAHKTASQEWMWSIGDSPLAHTSSGVHFTQTETDTVHRNYVVFGLEEAANLVNEGIQELQSHRTTPANNRPDVIERLQKAKQAYENVLGIMDFIARKVGLLKFVDAVENLPKLQNAAEKFRALCSDVGTVMETTKCVDSTNLSQKTEKTFVLLVFPTIFIALDLIIVALVIVCRSGPKKMKTN